MDTNIALKLRQPKYRIGDRVRQGLIVGLESYPADSYLAQMYGTQWRYTLLLNKVEEDLEYIYEPYIEPFSPQELRAEIEEEIAQHKQQLEALQNELAAAQLGNSTILNTTLVARSPGTIGSSGA